MTRTFLVWLMLVALSIALFAQERRLEDRLRLGQKAPAFRDSASTRQRTALVFVPTLPDIAACKSEIESLSRLQTLLQKANVAVTIVVPYTELKWRSFCTSEASETPMIYDADRMLTTRYGAAQGRLSVLIDEEGVVRRIVRSTGAQFIDSFAADVRAWDEGKGIYESACARCHGVDGANTGYAEIKTLSGIGNRMDETEIIRRTSLTSNVDLSSFNESRFRALAIYVAGL
jgi:peroxiredoxin